MASILLISASLTGNAHTRTKATFEAAGHTVTGSGETVAELDVAWGAGRDVIVTAGSTGDVSATPRPVTAWVIDKWLAGTPVMLGAPAGYNEYRHIWARAGLGPGFDQSASTGVSSRMDSVLTSHPIIEPLSGNVAVLTGPSEGVYTNTNAGAGAVVGYWGDRAGLYQYMMAFEVGAALATSDAIHAATEAPARAVLCGWLWGEHADYTTDGAAILDRAVEWLAPSGPPTFEIAAAATHHWMAVATLHRDHYVAAQAAHEWTATAALDAGTPTEITATAAHSWTATAALDNGAEVAATATHAWQLEATLENGELQSITATVSHEWAVTALLENGETTLDGWTRDQSQQVVLDVTGPDTNPAGPLLVDRAPVPAPAEVTEQPVEWESPQALPEHFTVGTDGSVHSTGQWEIVDGDLGVPHVWVDGVDITYLRGASVALTDIATSDPGGWEHARLVLPQVSALEDHTTAPDLAWMREDAQVESYWVDANGDKVRDAEGQLIERFSGHLVSDGAQATDSVTATVWECAGDMVQAAYVYHQPPITLEPTDIGVLIPRVLNSVVSRRYGTIAEVKTGIMTSKRGSGDDRVWDYVAELLAEAWTPAGRQWTLARTGVRRQYELRLKGDGGRSWTVTPFTPGIEVRLDADHATRSDAVYGRGINRDGYAWQGRYWPSLLAYDPPDYPNASAGNTIAPGESDADTDFGDGVSVWEQRAADLGYDVPVDGYLSASDSDVVRDVQRKMGLTVDGIIGPQTWTGTWEVGVDSGALESIRLPLAWRPEVEPNLYGAQGNVTGPNPAYDPRVIRRERSIDYGVPVPKSSGVRSSELEVKRSQTVGWVGEVTLKTDPHEGSRHLIQEGDSLTVLGWRGRDVALHVIRVVPGDAAGEVKVTLDTKARDAMTVSSIRRRNQDAAIDPARRPGNVNRKSRQARDLRVEFEGESPAGRIHRRALFAGLWSVFPVPVSEAGNIVKLDVHTESPVAEFTIGFFAAPVQPSHLLRLVGNPAADSSAWRKRLPQLEARGFIEAWGAGESMAGHWPDQEGPVTGRLIDTGGWSYYSDHGGWVWVAAWSPVSTFIEGRVYPAPVE